MSDNSFVSDEDRCTLIMCAADAEGGVTVEEAAYLLSWAERTLAESAMLRLLIKGDLRITKFIGNDRQNPTDFEVTRTLAPSR